MPRQKYTFIYLTLMILTVIVSLAFNAYVPKPKTVPKEASTNLEELTNKIINYHSLDLVELRSIAEKRKSLMLREAVQNPDDFLLYTIPTEVRNSLPSQIKILIEDYVQIEGPVTLLIIDNFQEQVSADKYNLKDPLTGKIYQLHFSKTVTKPLPNTTVKARGYSLDDLLVVADLDSV